MENTSVSDHCVISLSLLEIKKILWTFSCTFRMALAAYRQFWSVLKCQYRVNGCNPRKCVKTFFKIHTPKNVRYCSSASNGSWLDKSDIYEVTSNNKNHTREESLEKILKDIKELEELKQRVIAEQRREQKLQKQFHIHDRDLAELENRQDISYITCGGCGVYLHCANPKIPGYVPSELFSDITTEKKPELLCQRCVFLNMYNKVLDQEVDKNVYRKVLKRILKRTSLVVVLVDVTDIVNSVVHEFLRKVKPSTSIILVGNKIDLIPKDSPRYRGRVLARLVNECLRYSPKLEQNVLHTCLISAKTGYGMEDLIDKLLSLYFDYEGKGCIKNFFRVFFLFLS